MQLRSLSNLGSQPSLEALFNQAARERVYPGRKGRVPKATLRTLLNRFVEGPDDAAGAGAVLAALPAIPDNLVSFRELAAAIRKTVRLAVRSRLLLNARRAHRCSALRMRTAH